MKKRFEFLVILLGLFIIGLNFISATPTFITIPANSSLLYGQPLHGGVVPLGVTFNATNGTGFNLTSTFYSIDNTAFTINSTGYLTNVSSMTVGTYSINVTATTNDSVRSINWTIYTVQVNQSNDDCKVYFNSTTGVAITYPSNFIAYTNCSSTYTLYRNGTAITNNSIVNAGAGYYNITVQRSDATNYTNISDTQFFTVNKNSEKFNVLFNASSGTNFPGNFSAWANSTSAFTLYKNGTTISNNSVQDNIAAGTYNFSAQRTDTANYTYTYNDTSFILNKRVSVVTTYINGSESNVIVESGGSVWLNGTLTTGVLGNLGLSVDVNSQNSSATGNPPTVSKLYTGFNAPGVHNVTTSYTGNENYSIGSETFNVTVVDTTAPTYSSKSTNNISEVGKIAIFGIYVNDNSALSLNGKYIFSTNNTGTWHNDSAVLFTVSPSWANATKTLNTTSGTLVGYRWYFNDTSNNTNSTPIYVLNTTADITAPTYSGELPDTNYAGRAVGFTINVADNVPNGQYVFSTDNSGVWVNDSVESFTGISDVATNAPMTLTSTVGKVVSYMWYFNDTVGNTNSTPIYTLTTILWPGSGGGTSSGGGGGGGGTVSPTTYTADEQFSGGVGDEYNNLGVSDKINFVISSVSHSITLNKFNSTTATVTIASNPIIAYLQKGVLYEFDTNGDGVNDVRVRYDGLVGTKASIFIQEIAPVVSTPPTQAASTPTQTTTTTTTPNQTTTKSTSLLSLKTLIIVIAIIVVVLIILLLTNKKSKKDKRYYSFGY